jgi:4-hydroxy-tetrahydrodipicolinate synthase
VTGTPLQRPLRGVIPPLATPLRDRERLDHAGLERLVEHVLAGGVHGLFLLGTTGEGPGLPYPLRRELVERVCQQAAGRVPVLVGITDTVFAESVDLAEWAADAGAQAVVAAPPYYFPLAQGDLRRYLEALVAAVPLPVLLYNIPSHTRAGYEDEALRAAVQMPRVVGIKDSSGDLDYFRRAVGLLAERPDWSVLIGPEEKLAEAVRLGGHGGVCGGANLDPRLYVDIYEAASAGDLAQVKQLQARVAAIFESIYAVGVREGYWLKGLKCALAALGLGDDYLAEPLHRLEGEPRRAVEAAARRLVREVVPG